MEVKRDMMLSYELSIEQILGLIRDDIIKAKETRNYSTDRIHIITRIYA